MANGNKRKVSGGRVAIPPALGSQLEPKIVEGSMVEWTLSGNQLILRVVGYEEPKRRVEVLPPAAEE